MSDVSDMKMKQYGSAAAAGYDQGFAHVSSYFIPFLIRAGRVAAGQTVLDIATGTVSKCCEIKLSPCDGFKCAVKDR